MVLLTFSYRSFSHKSLVTAFAKGCAVIALILLNLFFVYFTVLHAAAREYAWQRHFVSACVLQFIVEMLLFETSEVYWVHFVVPQLAFDDVKGAFEIVRREVATLVSLKEGQDPCVASAVFDASRYFFLSRQLAEKFPFIWEAAVVSAYSSPTPPRHLSLSEGNDNTGFAPSAHWGPLFMTRRFFQRLGAAFGTLGIFLGTINIRIQKLVLHTIQPIVLGGGFLVYSDIGKSKWLGAFPIFSILCLFVYHIRRRTVKAPAPVEPPVAMVDAPFQRAAAHGPSQVVPAAEHDSEACCGKSSCALVAPRDEPDVSSQKEGAVFRAVGAVAFYEMSDEEEDGAGAAMVRMSPSSSSCSESSGFSDIGMCDGEVIRSGERTKNPFELNSDEDEDEDENDEV
jgi:hypothetical protein